MTTQSDTSGARLDPAAICTLPPSEIGERLRWIRNEILPHAIRSEPIEDGIAWELADEPGLAAKLDRLIELERTCCSEIAFEQAPSTTPGQRRLEAHGADPNAAIFKLSGEAPGEPARLGRQLAKASGWGALTALLVCCLLPIGLVALLGAAAAAPFTGLDQPLFIIAIAALSGAAAFAWQRRKPKTSPRPSAPSCGLDC